MKKTKLLFKILSLLFLLYGLVGFFILPGIIKKQIIQNAEKILTRKLNIESVSCNPYTFQVGIHNLIVLGKHGESAFAGVRDFEVNIDPMNLFMGEIKVKFIEISAPFARIHKDEKGKFNFSDLLVPREVNTSKEEESKTELPAFLIEKFSIKSGKIHFLDETGSKPFEETLKPINFTLRDFSTMKDHKNQLSLHIKLDDGAKIDYRGKISSIEPLRSQGSLELYSGRLYTQWEYFRDTLGFVVADGALDASLHYTADFSAKPMQIHIDEYKLKIDSLRLQDKKTEENILLLPSLSLNGNADLGTKQVNVEGFFIEGFTIKALRDEKGVINWLSYLPVSEPDKNSSKKPSQEVNETDPWKVDIAKVDIKTDELTFEEHFVEEPYLTGVKNLSFDIKDIKLIGDALYVNEFKTHLSDFSLRPLTSQKDWIGFKSLSVDGKLSKTKSTDINLSLIHLDKLAVFADMNKQGVLNFSKLSPKKENLNESKEVKAKGESSPLNWKIEHFKLSQTGLDFRDNLNAKDGLIKLDKVNLDLYELSSVKGSWARSELSARINKTGIVKINSKIRQSPLKIKSQFKLTGLNLPSFQAYMNKNANIDINSGILNLDFKAEHDEKTSKLRANTLINNLDLSERREGKTFFAFSKLLIKDIDLSLNPDQMKIVNVDIYEPYARMKVDEKKISNLDGIAVSNKSKKKSSKNKKTKSAKKKAFPVFISKVNFKEGKGEFSDLSLPLPFKTDIHDLNGEMLGLGNHSTIKTKVDIDGIVDEYGLAKIEGQLLSANPKAFTDMGVKFQNIDMTNLSPYTGKFIGYKLKEGKMNVELDYKIKNSQMQGGNRIILKKLTLGDKVESEDAISAPVGLAIALLKDGDGVIDLDVPVSGDVNKPNFEIGHVVWTAFKNLIVGVATAPFKFLGDALGISAEELANIQFEAGKRELLPPEREKLDKLSEALSSKKMLILKVAGSYAGGRDLLAMKIKNLSQMDKDEADNLLEKLYISHFKQEGFDKIKEKIETKDVDLRKSDLRKEMTQGLVKVSKQELLLLAKQRAEAIISYLVKKGLSPDRLELLEGVELEITEAKKEYIPTKLELGAR